MSTAFGSLEDDERVELLERVRTLEERVERLESWAAGEQDVMENVVGRLVVIAGAIRKLRLYLPGSPN